MANRRSRQDNANVWQSTQATAVYFASEAARIQAELLTSQKPAEKELKKA
jgi:hypothetical protein